MRVTASTVENKISCAYVEIIKHQQANNRTNSPLPVAGSSLLLNEHPAACGWRWELGGEHSSHAGGWGSLAISGTGDEAAVKTDTEELLRTCCRAALLLLSIQSSSLIFINQSIATALQTGNGPQRSQAAGVCLSQEPLGLWCCRQEGSIEEVSPEKEAHPGGVRLLPV